MSEHGEALDACNGALDRLGELDDPLCGLFRSLISAEGGLTVHQISTLEGIALHVVALLGHSPSGRIDG